MKALLSLVPAIVAAAFAGCGSGPDPSAGSEVAGNLLAPTSSNSSQYIVGVALGTGLFAATGASFGPAPGVYAVSFAPPTATPFPFMPPNTGGPGGAIELAAAADGTLWWAEGVQLTMPGVMGAGQVTVPGVDVWSADQKAPTGGPPTSFPLTTSTMGGSNASTVVGLVADADAIYVAASQPTNNNGGGSMPGQSPDDPQWPSGILIGTALQHAVAPGAIFAIAGGGTAGTTLAVPPSVGARFDPSVALHTLVETNAELFWLNATSDRLDAVSHIAKAPNGWPGGAGPATLPLQPRNGWSLAGIAARGETVAVIAAPDPEPGATGCSVWVIDRAGLPRALYDSQQGFLCRSIALDDSYAYVTMNAIGMQTQGQGGEDLVGSGIARVSLSGGSGQTPQVVPLQSDRWLGPRRVFVDDAYVYAVDPSYVLRVPKTAFGP